MGAVPSREIATAAFKMLQWPSIDKITGASALFLLIRLGVLQLPKNCYLFLFPYFQPLAYTCMYWVNSFQPNINRLVPWHTSVTQAWQPPTSQWSICGAFASKDGNLILSGRKAQLLHLQDSPSETKTHTTYWLIYWLYACLRAVLCIDLLPLVSFTGLTSLYSVD